MNVLLCSEIMREKHSIHSRVMLHQRSFRFCMKVKKAGYYFKNKSSHNRINQLQKKSTLIVTMQEQGEAITSEEKETEDFEKEMEEYIFQC